MTKRRSGGDSKRARRHGQRNREWVGGRVSPPFFITDRDEPYRPAMVFWIDATDGLIVGQGLAAPEEADGAVGRALLTALDHPLAGSPRRPDVIRVASAALAAEVRAVLGDAVPIEIAPTPELDEVLEAFLESMHDEDEIDSYFEDGRVPPEAVAALFEAAARLYSLAPWRMATDDQILRLDIPALGIEGACVSILGNLGEALGLAIFSSLAGYEAFARAVDGHFAGSRDLDFGSDWLVLGFELGTDLPAGMRREVSAHGWPVVDANAYPCVSRRERDGAPRPLVERDVKIAGACAAALANFASKYPGVFDEPQNQPVRESYLAAPEFAVHLTYPYGSKPRSARGDAPMHAQGANQRVGRNDPCPCGSGKKYKKCHLPTDEAERAPAPVGAADHHLAGERMYELSKFALERFGSEWRGFEDDFDDFSESLQLAVPWSLYVYEIGGQSILDWYLAETGRSISPFERGWLEAERAAWLSVWEVTGVEPGRSITLRDLLSHEERCVQEVSGSAAVVVRDAVLARVVDQAGISLFSGVHPQPLPPFDAAEVVRLARGRLRLKRAVPVERLREEAFGRYLIARWEDAVFELDFRASIPPELHNSDGDPLLITNDHFRFERGARAEIAKRLGRIEGVSDGEDAAEGGSEYVFLGPAHSPPPGWAPAWGPAVVGRAWLADTALRVETNSIARADTLRARIESASGDLVQHRLRDHSDPLSPAVAAGASATPSLPRPPEAEQMVLDYKLRHYAEWPDITLPALGGRSPREAIRTAQGRRDVDVLLKDMENREQRAFGPGGFDFGGLRRELGLD